MASHAQGPLTEHLAHAPGALLGAFHEFTHFTSTTTTAS